ncbi:MAG: hypothetical protein AAFO91_17895, partial [Bacteroidota bacterium]
MRNRSLVFCILAFASILIPKQVFGQYTVTQCQTVTDALIGPDRNDFAHNVSGLVNEAYLHNFDVPALPCGLETAIIQELNVSIDLQNINAAGCPGIPIFGNVLFDCALSVTSICPIEQDVLSPGCSFGIGEDNIGLYTLNVASCPPVSVNPPPTTIGVDIVPATDAAAASCAFSTSAITDGLVDVTYEICVELVYDQDIPADCDNTTSLACDDGDPCTDNDMVIVDNCDNSIICVPCAGTPTDDCSNTIALGCDDGDPCTDNDQEIVEACDNSIICVPCAGTPTDDCSNTVALACDDGDPCTDNVEVIVEACDNSIICVPCAGTPTDESSKT